jgi:hypothetical protein
MRSATILAILCVAAPAAAFAQRSYSHAYISPPVVLPAEPVYPAQPAYPCSELERQKGVLDDEKVTYDRQRDQLDSEGARLSGELRQLDSTNTTAVADYNARSDEHNRRVADHNRRVAEMNDQVARLSADIANAAPYCNSPRWRLLY